MYRSKGFTLTEVLVVIGIICVLASLGFFASAPSREAARQTTCANQLKQFYVIAQLYAADYDHGSGYPELHGLAYMPSDGRNPVDQLKDYGMTRELLFCPSSSTVMRRHLGSSYLWPISSRPVNPDGTMSKAREMMIAREQQQGSKLSIVECHIHDELYYSFREDTDPLITPPFRIRLFVDGGIGRGRVSPPRTFIFTDMAYQ
jgi:prepilin-type N-terminal cleavage/methylation domain-containing protein